MPVEASQQALLKQQQQENSKHIQMSGMKTKSLWRKLKFPILSSTIPVADVLYPSITREYKYNSGVQSLTVASKCCSQECVKCNTSTNCTAYEVSVAQFLSATIPFHAVKGFTCLALKFTDVANPPDSHQRTYKMPSRNFAL